MTSERLRQFVRARPFRPFRVVMTNGQVYDVNHPEFLAVSPRDDTAVVYQDNGDLSVLDVLLMTEVQVFAPEAAHAG